MSRLAAAELVLAAALIVQLATYVALFPVKVKCYLVINSYAVVCHGHSSETVALVVMVVVHK